MTHPPFLIAMASLVLACTACQSQKKSPRPTALQDYIAGVDAEAALETKDKAKAKPVTKAKPKAKPAPAPENITIIGNPPPPQPEIIETDIVESIQN